MISPLDPKTRIAEWLACLQHSGYRVTKPRRVVVEILAESDRALDAAEIYAQARGIYSSLGLVSVYRTLERLETLGLVQRVHHPDGCQAFIAGFTGHQHLLICQSCGKAEFFEGDDPMFPNRKTFTDLAPRSYEVIIQDDLGCTITQTITITEPTELVAGIADSTPETCLGDADGTVTLQVNGGTPPYEFAVNSSDPADFAPNPSQFFDNLAGGDTYVIFVRDSQGCETNVIVPVGIGVDLMPEAIVTYGCEGIFPNNSVEVAVQDTGQYPFLLFALDPVDPTDAITAQATDVREWGDLVAGDHTVYIYHQNGCTTSVDFTIDAYDPLTLGVVKTAANEITATATGGYGGYEYFFNNVSYGSDNVYTANQDETVTVRVVDLRGCEAVVAFPFDFTGMLDIPNFFTPDGDNMNDFWYPRNRDFFPNIEVIIYDRYGRVVARLDQVSKWDGNYDGKPVPTGDYWYVVNANDKEKQQYVGHFTLYR